MTTVKKIRFRENYEFGNMVQPHFNEVFRTDYKLKGRWRSDFFENNNPIVLELGCGRGEYAVELGRRNPNINYLGVDIKGARMWHGAKMAYDESLDNVGFLRTEIEYIESFFGKDEIDEIWLTFPDPQLQRRRVKKRLVSPVFLSHYSGFLKPSGTINLKTDSGHLHRYTKAVIEENSLELIESCEDIYGESYADATLSIKTAYEKHYLKSDSAITYLEFSLNGVTDFSAPEFEPDEHLSKPEDFQ